MEHGCQGVISAVFRTEEELKVEATNAGVLNLFFSGLPLAERKKYNLPPVHHY